MRFARILEHGQEYLVSLRRGLCGAVRHIEEQCYFFTYASVGLGVVLRHNRWIPTGGPRASRHARLRWNVRCIHGPIMNVSITVSRALNRHEFIEVVFD